jgi:hypothetical protein
MPRLIVKMLISGLLAVSLNLGCRAKQARNARITNFKREKRTRVMKTDRREVRRFISADAAKNALAPNIPPASCDEWATQSFPPYPVGTKCKVLGGSDLCYRVSGTHAGSYDIGPIVGQQQVGKPLTVHFRIRDFGSGDYVIYAFGKVDWGDNSQ